MYYIEKMINGQLMFKCSKDDEWTPCGTEQCNRKIVYLESVIAMMKEGA